MGGICYQKNNERGPWFEIKCTKEVIINKEARGENANFERELLESWAKYPGYEEAGNALRECGKMPSGTRETSKSTGTKRKTNGNLSRGAE